jgi:predicted CXXCH cytochrome family protein
MPGRIPAACAGLALFFAASACSPPARHATLSFFFDGVPPLAEVPAPGEPMAAHAVPAQKRFLGHGPYAARLCNSCHDSAAGNSFVAPLDELCTRCHDLGPPKKVVHDPAGSGECLACHDPHDSAQPYLLVAAPNKVCGDCHEQAVLPEDAAHTDPGRTCTECHDPHQSDKESLLR